MNEAILMMENEAILPLKSDDFCDSDGGALPVSDCDSDNTTRFFQGTFLRDLPGGRRRLTHTAQQRHPDLSPADGGCPSIMSAPFPSESAILTVFSTVL